MLRLEPLFERRVSEWTSEYNGGSGFLRFGWIGVQVDVGDIEDVVFGVGAILFGDVRCSARDSKEHFNGEEDVPSAGSCLGR